MTSRQRIMTTLSLKIPDKVPKDFWGFNREAHKLFKNKTGSDDPAEYFKIDCRYIGINNTRVDVNEYRKFHKSEFPPGVSFNEWGTAFGPCL